MQTSPAKYSKSLHQALPIVVKVVKDNTRDSSSTCHSPYHSCRNDRIPPESTGIRWNETGIRWNANQFHRNATGIRWNRYKLPYLGTPLVNNII